MHFLILSSRWPRGTHDESCAMSAVVRIEAFCRLAAMVTVATFRGLSLLAWLEEALRALALPCWLVLLDSKSCFNLSMRWNAPARRLLVFKSTLVSFSGTCKLNSCVLTGAKHTSASSACFAVWKTKNKSWNPKCNRTGGRVKDGRFYLVVFHF